MARPQSTKELLALFKEYDQALEQDKISQFAAQHQDIESINIQSIRLGEIEQKRGGYPQNAVNNVSAVETVFDEDEESSDEFQPAPRSVADAANGGLLARDDDEPAEEDAALIDRIYQKWHTRLSGGEEEHPRDTRRSPMKNQHQPTPAVNMHDYAAKKAMEKERAAKLREDRLLALEQSGSYSAMSKANVGQSRSTGDDHSGMRTAQQRALYESSKTSNITDYAAKKNAQLQHAKEVREQRAAEREERGSYTSFMSPARKDAAGGMASAAPATTPTRPRSALGPQNVKSKFASTPTSATLAKTRTKVTPTNTRVTSSLRPVTATTSKLMKSTSTAAAASEA